MDQHDEFNDEALVAMAEGMTTILNEIAISATVQASATIAEALSLAFDNCMEEGRPLSFTQRMDIQHAFLFVFREYEDLLRKQIGTILTVHAIPTDMSPEDFMTDGDS